MMVVVVHLVVREEVVKVIGGWVDRWVAGWVARSLTGGGRLTADHHQDGHDYRTQRSHF